MNQKKYLFIDRDGTLIVEPDDQQIDSLAKLQFLPDIFTALKRLMNSGFKLIMITNQDGLGTESFPKKNFQEAHNFMLKIFESQQITFDSVLICPHFSTENCECRKPKLGLVMDYLVDQSIDKNNSYVIGDRETDMQFANNLGITGFLLGSPSALNWQEITRKILEKPRKALVIRNTNETKIKIEIDLDSDTELLVSTGIRFFDHMCEQIIKHAGISGSIVVQGDLDVDDHHIIEDTAIALGTAIKKALNDKRGITRFGFIAPMDDARATVALDLSGRSFCVVNANLTREKISDFSTEMLPHFFRSFAEGLQATLHVDILGENNHHQVESAFKALGRALRQAIKIENQSIPSTKGVLC